MILFICCMLLSLIGLVQNTACGGADKMNTCNGITGGVACAICCGAIILMLNK